MEFSCQLVNLPITLGTVCITHFFFQGLKFIFDIISLYYFKVKVLRVLLKFESPKSEHRNSSYVLNNQANLYSKTEPESGLHMALL